MKKISLVAFALTAALSNPSFAVECGEPPVNAPAVPNGENSDAATIRSARDAVITYSEAVDAYLQCMDEKSVVVLPYMSKEQKFRWEEDLANLHNQRRDAQTSMNEAIRSYRRAQQ